jgi:hypothetical protein
MSFRNRLCLVTDIAEYSRHTIPERADGERRLARVQQFALSRAGALRVKQLPRQDRGDGQLLLLPPTLDPTTAIPGLVAGLRHALYQANSDPGLFGRLRIRVSMAQGAVSRQGPLGSRGDALITACRLNDAEPLKEALRQKVAADLAFIVPDDIYRDVIRHDFGGLRSDQFTSVKIAVKEYDGAAWMFVPDSGPAPDLVDASSDRLWRSAAVGGLIAGVAVTAGSTPPPPSEPGAGNVDEPQSEITHDYWSLHHDSTHDYWGPHHDQSNGDGTDGYGADGGLL